MADSWIETEMSLPAMIEVKTAPLLSLSIGHSICAAITLFRCCEEAGQQTRGCWGPMKNFSFHHNRLADCCRRLLYFTMTYIHTVTQTCKTPMPLIITLATLLPQSQTYFIEQILPLQQTPPSCLRTTAAVDGVIGQKRGKGLRYRQLLASLSLSPQG